jgi:hypothetical protein
MPTITPTWNENTGYTGDNPLAEGATNWSYDENKGWSKWEPSTNPTLNAETIQSLTPYNINTDTAPGESRFEISGGQAATDPNAYYSQLSSDLASKIWENNAANAGGRNTEYNNLLESIKTVNPAAYYNAQVQLLGSEIGHASAMGETDRQAAAQKKLYDLAPQAISAGITPEQLNATANSSFSSGANYGQAIKSHQAVGSGFWKDNLIGTAKVMAMALGAAGADAALGAGADAALGAGAEAAGAGGNLTASSVPNLTGGLELGTTNGAVAGGSGWGGLTAASTGGAGLTASSVPSLVGGLEVGSAGALGSTPFAGGLEQMGPTYNELGVTGVPEGGMGPTYNEMGYTGLNQQAAINAANAAAGTSSADVLTNANRAKNIANLLKQGAGSGLSSSLGQLAQGANPQGQALVNVVRGNQNPFSYSPQQPIQDTRQAQLASLLKQG